MTTTDSPQQTTTIPCGQGRASGLARNPAEDPFPPWLSPRQGEVLVLAAQGLSNAAIGTVLHIGEDSVKTHMRRVFHLLGARNRAHAVHIAHQLRIAEIMRADPKIQRRQPPAPTGRPQAERVGMVHPTVPADRRRPAAPTRPPATHWLQIEDHHRPDRCLRVDIRTTDQQARYRLDRLAALTWPPGLVHLIAADGVRILATRDGHRTGGQQQLPAAGGRS